MPIFHDISLLYYIDATHDDFGAIAIDYILVSALAFDAIFRQCTYYRH